MVVEASQIDAHEVDSSSIQSEDWVPELTEEEQAAFDEATQDPDQIVEWAVRAPEQLNDIETILVILNRCIGTGVFSSATVITYNTQSLGLSIIFWMCGSIIALAGTYIYVELGLTIPRFSWNGEEISTPRNGGELNYLYYLMKKPKYFAHCVFGIPFLVICNTAANSINFGHNILQMAGKQATYGATCGLGIAATTFACILHSLSRRWGIRLNNFLGLSKMLIVLFLIVIGFVTAGILSHRADGEVNDLAPATAFNTTEMLLQPNSGPSNGSPYRFAEAFLFVLFPFGGFHQANHVLAEIKQPNVRFRRSAFTAVIIVCVMFTLLNLAFTMVVPKDQQFSGKQDIGQIFFRRSMSTLAGTDTAMADRAFAGLKAVSSLGNIIVVTFTASRVKQEIAKEGILPKSLFWAKSYDLSPRRWFNRQRQQTNYSSNTTPVPALFLHWFFTAVVVISALVGVRNSRSPPTDAYYFVVSVYAYVLDVVIFAWIAVCVLRVRLTPESKWHEKSHANRWLSILSALILLAGTAFPLTCLWVKDPSRPTLGRSDSIAWFTSQTVGISIFVFAIIYWFGFRWIVPRVSGWTFTSDRTPIFTPEGNGLMMTFEMIKAGWGHEKSSEPNALLEVREKARTQHSTADPRLVEREATKSPNLQMRERIIRPEV